MLSSGREYFYPRSPYGERRIILRNRISLSADFYPRSPYGERRSRSFLSMSKVWISIHALLTESDYLATWQPDYVCYFYPRSPYGERRVFGSGAAGTNLISIHALLTESDAPDFARLANPLNFYPRSPYGERPAAPLARREAWPFLSTLSLRRATTHDFTALNDILISIHALLAESDEPGSCSRHLPQRFLSTLSLRRATAYLPFDSATPEDFYPRSPCGERRVRAGATATNMEFLSTLSLRRATLRQ